MALVIFINSTYEENEQALVNTTTGQVILNGDYDHDKINYRIAGYLKALDDHGLVTVEAIENIYIDTTHEMFKKLEFYDGSEDY
ncbi:hypothetical protein CPT_Mater135 [Bacillus phage Mater]|uniref:Uncharacterized protein n=1 Tax=Bacillus phage Mater TaxID=1540090 RepID=A0A0A0RMT3_9CAUD|nr:transcriptional regulator [Bacillus phage Mater]AIW03292.1 hypothetical protein CPT_Mater135 [Bacillus phage Mater]